MKAKQLTRTGSGIKYHGETFSGYNKPKRAPQGSPKKYVVLAKDSSGNVKKVSFGARGYQDFLQHKDTKRRANFKSRMNCSSEKNKLTAKWWACNYNW
jgi:hypothetical protein